MDILIGSLFCVGLCVRSGLSLVGYISCGLLVLVLKYWISDLVLGRRVEIKCCLRLEVQVVTAGTF